MGDYVAEARHQVAKLEAAKQSSNLDVDWDWVIKEIEGVVSGEKGELRNRVRTVVEHMLKQRFSPATDPLNGWKGTLRRTRADIAEILEESESLRDELPKMVARACRLEAGIAADDLLDRKEVDARQAREIRSTTFTVEEVLGDGGLGGEADEDGVGPA